MLLWNMFDSQYGLVFRAKHALCVWRSEHTGVMPTPACPKVSNWTGDASAGGAVSVPDTVTGAAVALVNKTATARQEDSSLGSLVSWSWAVFFGKPTGSLGYDVHG